jgi:3-oxoacyl-[acyl-carrier protein] reductase
MLLENKNTVVYGAGGAVGGAVARTFAREGARVFLAGRTLAKLEHVAAEIRAAGGTAETAQVDAFDARAIEAHFAAASAADGGIDAVFNAVGVGDLPGAPLVDMTCADFKRPIAEAMETNFIIATTAARHMVKRGKGAVLTITALHNRAPIPLFGAGPSAWAAVEALYRSLAVELGPKGLRFGVLCSAGSPDAPNMDRVGDRLAAVYGISRSEMEAGATDSTLLRRFPKLAEVANAAAFYASDYASAITASALNVTCGAVQM